MKKSLLTGVSMVVLGLTLTGCSLFPKANGIILYGDEQQITDSLDQEKENLIEEEQFTIKLADEEEQRIMIMNEETAHALIEKGLIMKVKNANESEAISSIPELAQGESILFAKEVRNEISIEGQSFDVKYEANNIIGDGRIYVDMFLIVDDTDWPSIKGKEKTLAIMEYKSDPSDRMGLFDVEGTQLVKISEYIE